MPLLRPGQGHPVWVAALALSLAIGLPHKTDGMSFVRDMPPFPEVSAPARHAPEEHPGTRDTDDQETPARIEVGPGGRDLLLSGDLTPGVAARVASILAAHPRIARIHLTSDGGLVDEAEALGRLVTARKLSTYVPDTCASACTLVFAHGRRRYVAVGGELGFHAPYEVGPDGRMLAVDPAPERAAYRAAGLPRHFVAQVMAVPPADIWIPSPAQLRGAGVVTEYIAAGRFPGSPATLAQNLRGGTRHADVADLRHRTRSRRGPVRRVSA